MGYLRALAVLWIAALGLDCELRENRASWKVQGMALQSPNSSSPRPNLQLFEIQFQGIYLAAAAGKIVFVQE